MITNKNTQEEKTHLERHIEQTKASQLAFKKRMDARFDNMNPQTKNLVPEKYRRYNFVALEDFEFRSNRRGVSVSTRPRICPNCGKKSSKVILKVEVPIEDIENNVAEYQELVKDKTIVYVRKKSYETSEYQVVGLWYGKYNTHQYGHFCKLRCCQTYANRKFEGKI